MNFALLVLALLNGMPRATTAFDAVAAQYARDSIVNDTVMVGGAGTPLLLELHGRADAGGGPIILYLHGGPGSAIGLIAFRAYAGPALESNALVAYLHQRGVLGSPSVLASQQTIANHVKDVLFTMDYLSRRYPDRPIYLLGHSWGGLLAIETALEHPAHLAGVILVSSPFDMDVGERASYDATLAWARQNNDTAVQALVALGPPPYTTLEQQITLSRWASTGNGGIDAHFDPAVVFGRPPYLAFDPAWGDAELAIARAMLAELFRARTSDRVAGLSVPLLVIDGSRDLIVPVSSIRSGYDKWGGPKSFVELTNSHHLPFIDEPARFADVVRQFVHGEPVH